jgi:hypothetical protein
MQLNPVDIVGGEGAAFQHGVKEFGVEIGKFKCCHGLNLAEPDRDGLKNCLCRKKIE